MSFRPGRRCTPGPVQGFGRLGRDDVPVICIPGEPVAALVAFEVFVRPAIRLMLGKRQLFRRTVQAVAGQQLLSPLGYRQYLHGTVMRHPDGGYVVEPVGDGTEALLARMARANCLIVIDEDVTEVARRRAGHRHAAAARRLSWVGRPALHPGWPAPSWAGGAGASCTRCAAATPPSGAGCGWPTRTGWRPGSPRRRGRWAARHTPAAYRAMRRAARRRARLGTSLPFAVRRRRPAGRPGDAGQRRARRAALGLPRLLDRPGGRRAAGWPRWRWPWSATTPSARSGCTGCRPTSARRTCPAGGWSSGWVSARRGCCAATSTSTATGATTSAYALLAEDLPGGVLARVAATDTPSRATARRRDAPAPPVRDTPRSSHAAPRTPQRHTARLPCSTPAACITVATRE